MTRSVVACRTRSRAPPDNVSTWATSSKASGVEATVFVSVTGRSIVTTPAVLLTATGCSPASHGPSHPNVTATPATVVSSDSNASCVSPGAWSTKFWTLFFSSPSVPWSDCAMSRPPASAGDTPVNGTASAACCSALPAAITSLRRSIAVASSSVAGSAARPTDPSRATTAVDTVMTAVSPRAVQRRPNVRNLASAIFVLPLKTGSRRSVLSGARLLHAHPPQELGVGRCKVIHHGRQLFELRPRRFARPVDRVVGDLVQQVGLLLQERDHPITHDAHLRGHVQRAIRGER